MPPSTEALDILVLIVRERTYALPLAGVVEVMRPLPLRALEGAPAYVLGIATIRGQAVPVVDPGQLVAGTPGTPRRFVTVRSGQRLVALAVEAVVGVRQLPRQALADLPGFLANAAAGALAGLGAPDGEVLALLDAGKLLPTGLWGELA
ncbi:MAG: CheW-like protein [Cyanobacteria bacterium RYN_339]|nr:CheW-like protein [Cyanobacteria bacterium RYN_339]